MANTYGTCLYHVAFSTKGRAPLIDRNWEHRLLEYIGGIARSNGFASMGVGGVEDHVHMVLSLSPATAPAKAVQLVKGGSSKWINETFPLRGRFAWQEGYGVFTVGFQELEAVRHYIQTQREHHDSGGTFEEEYRRLLRANEVAFDERYLLG